MLSAWWVLALAAAAVSSLIVTASLRRLRAEVHRTRRSGESPGRPGYGQVGR